MRAFSEGHMTSLKKKEREKSLNNVATNLCLLRRLGAMTSDAREVNLEVCGEGCSMELKEDALSWSQPIK